MLLGPIMLDIVGTRLTEEDIHRLLHPHTGGVILFTRNYVNIGQLIELTQQIHALRRPPLLIAVDHEGGNVQRFKKDFTKLPAMRELGEIWNKQPARACHLARQVGFLLAAELNVCGVDFSFTPVLDLDYGRSCIIGNRAFHKDPIAVSDLAYNLMLGLEKGGMLAVGKHFPGHGYIRADSHLEKPIDQRQYLDIEMNDLIPFQQMINLGLAGIMPSHVSYLGVDQSPASFSSVWLQKILRTELQFEGCIFSDDLSMQGAVDHLDSIVMRAYTALSAGCDMVLVCNNPEGVDELLNRLQWKMSAASLSRLARMYAKNIFGSMEVLKETVDYIGAAHEISLMVSE